MIADTSFLVALFVKEDAMHQQAMNKFSLIAEQITIPDRILEETFTVLAYKKGITLACEMLDNVKENADIKIYHINEEEQEKVMALIKSEKSRMSFNDYIVVYLSLRERTEPLCFDNEIKKMLKKLV